MISTIFPNAIELRVLSGQPFGGRLRCFGHIVNLVVRALMQPLGFVQSEIPYRNDVEKEV
jgi:hypothetical protein